MSLDEALKLAYPGCEFKRETRYLTSAQREEAARLSSTEVPSSLVVRYIATCKGKPGGRAYTDSHRVRTHPETVLVAVNSEGVLLRVEVLSFEEPTDYLPKRAWYDRFSGQKLGPELEIKKAIPPVTGATLTARSTHTAARRALALDTVLLESVSK